MQYGISEEPNAIFAYSKLTGTQVFSSGLWVNKKYVYLGASPNGLIFDSDKRLRGIVEVKCLKALRNQTMDECINAGIPSHSCVSVSGGEVYLKRNHSYLFQVQLQLLVTEAYFCDFVLHSKIGIPHVERIYSNIVVQKIIVENVQKFWYRVFVPEYFLMRVPRELLPILLDASTSRVVTNTF